MEFAWFIGGFFLGGLFGALGLALFAAVPNSLDSD
jgi:hypothetical protein